MRQAQQGFTLIELVVVITIIGILAAVALPRFVNLQRDARVAKLNAARGAVGAAAALVHSAYLSRNGVADTTACTSGGTASNALNGTICTENGLITLVNGYPSGAAPFAATAPGIIGAAGLTTIFSPTAAQLLAEGYIVSVNPTVIQMQGAPDAANCFFTYTDAAPNAAPIISAVTSTGC